MTLSEDVDLEEYILAKDDLSGADIKVRFFFVCLFKSKFSVLKVLYKNE